MVSNNPHYEGNSTTDKQNGDIIFYPRALNIVWGRDSRYWNIPDEEKKPAELLQVCWLEVTGSTEIVPGNSYEVIFKLSLTPNAFGWGGCPVYIMVKRGKDGNFVSKKHQLPTSIDTHTFEIKSKLITPDQPKQNNLSDTKLYFGLYEVWTGKWKGGLKIHQVAVKEASLAPA